MLLLQCGQHILFGPPNDKILTPPMLSYKLNLVN